MPVRAPPSRAPTGSSPAGWPDQTFLYDFDGELPVGGVDGATRQPTGRTGPRRLLVVEPPLVGAERPVEPHRVVEAGSVDAAPERRVRHERRVEQRHVR